MRAVHPGALVHLAISRELGGISRETDQALPKPSTTFLEAGEATFTLFRQAEVAAAREQAHYFYSLLKW